MDTVVTQEFEILVNGHVRKIEVRADLYKLALHLSKKACFSRSQKSTAVFGAVRVTNKGMSNE